MAKYSGIPIYDIVSRAILRKILNAETYKTPATIEDIDVLEVITKKVKEKGFGVKSALIYLEDH